MLRDPSGYGIQTSAGVSQLEKLAASLRKTGATSLADSVAKLAQAVECENTAQVSDSSADSSEMYHNLFADALTRDIEQTKTKAKGYADIIAYSGSLGTHLHCCLPSQLGHVAMRLLNLEHEALPLTERWWCSRRNRNHFKQRVHASVDPSELAQCILILESAIKRTALSSSWQGDTESAKVNPLADGKAKYAIGPRFLGPTSDDTLDGCSMSGGAPLSKVSQCAIIRSLQPPGELHSSAHHVIKSTPPEGVFSHNDRKRGESSSLRRKEWQAWRADTQRARTCAATALQLRALEGLIRWRESITNRSNSDEMELVERRSSPRKADAFEYRKRGTKKFKDESELPIDALIDFERWALQQATHLGASEVSLVRARQREDVYTGALVQIATDERTTIFGKVIRVSNVHDHAGHCTGCQVAFWHACSGRIQEISEEELHRAIDEGRTLLVKPEDVANDSESNEEDDHLTPVHIEAKWMSCLGFYELCALVKANIGKDFSRNSLSRNQLINSLPATVLSRLESHAGADEDVPYGDVSLLVAFNADAEVEGDGHDLEQKDDQQPAEDDEDSLDEEEGDQPLRNLRRRRKSRQPTQSVVRGAALASSDVDRGLQLLQALRQVDRSDGKKCKPLERLPSLEDDRKGREKMAYPCDLKSIESTLKGDGGFTSVPELLCAFELCFMNAQLLTSTTVDERDDADVLRDEFQRKAAELFPEQSLPPANAPRVRKSEWEPHAQLAAEITDAAGSEDDNLKDDNDFVLDSDDDDDAEVEGDEDWMAEEEVSSRTSGTKQVRQSTPPNQHETQAALPDGKQERAQQITWHAMLEQAAANFNLFINKSVLVNRASTQWWPAVINNIDASTLSVVVTYQAGVSSDQFSLMDVDTSICHGSLETPVQSGMKLAVFSHHQVWYAGVVQSANTDGAVALQYDDGQNAKMNLFTCHWQIVNSLWWINAYPRELQRYVVEQWWKYRQGFRMQQRDSMQSPLSQQSRTTSLSQNAFPQVADPVLPSRPFRGKVTLRADRCLQLLNELRRVLSPDQTHACAMPFEMVDARYFESAEKCTDLRTIEQKLRSGGYQGAEDLKNDLERLFTAVSQANPQQTALYRDAKMMIEALHWLLFQLHSGSE
jgi:hypothetical protein